MWERTSKPMCCIVRHVGHLHVCGDTYVYGLGTIIVQHFIQKKFYLLIHPFVWLLNALDSSDNLES